MNGDAATGQPPSSPHDEAGIDSIQKASFDYFREFSNPANGLVADSSVAGSPCSIAAVGFALSAYPVGVERGWISCAEGKRLVRTTLAFLEHLQTQPELGGSHNGFFYHFLGMGDGRRAWRSELSTIDTAILIVGVLTAAEYFGRTNAEIAQRAARIAGRVKWSWMEKASGAVRMGWKPESGFLRQDWRGYSEALLMFVIALGQDRCGLSPHSYTAWRESHEYIDTDAGRYAYSGPLFVHLLPQCWLDLRSFRDGSGLDCSYFENTQRAIGRHRQYARENPLGFSRYCGDMWGLSACLGPAQRVVLRNGRRVSVAGYAARGAPFGPDDGTLAPSVIAASLPFAPHEALAALDRLQSRHGRSIVNGRLIDSFNPSMGRDGPDGWYSTRFTAIDQGMVVLSIENFRSGLPWRLAARSSVLRRGLERAGFRACVARTPDVSQFVETPTAAVQRRHSPRREERLFPAA